eukprot:m.99907 g.99907  ORF g.99907 m.99907 type:complete len:176 (+) comp27202_c0_seq1:364-891(+)
MGFFQFGRKSKTQQNQYPIVGEASIMSRKTHGTCSKGIQPNLKYNADRENADRICCFNRHYAEPAGYFMRSAWPNEVDRNAATTYYDSVTAKPLFNAPVGRTFKQFLNESKSHGWPSFRDEEVNWENVRCLDNGECVSVDGTHLGHNIPDRKGNRYCINLISCAARPIGATYNQA